MTPQRTGQQHSKPAGASPFPPNTVPKPDQLGLGGKADGKKRIEARDENPWRDMHPTTTGDYERLIVRACTWQNQVNVPEFSEETSGVWRNIAHDAARPIITAFDKNPGTFEDILAKADQVAFSTEIGSGYCGGDMVVFLREVVAEVELRRRKRKEVRFHLTPEGKAFLSEIDTLAVSLGMKTSTEAGSLVRTILGCPAVEFPGSADDARALLASWKEKQDSMSRIVGDKPKNAPLASAEAKHKAIQSELDAVFGAGVVDLYSAEITIAPPAAPLALPGLAVPALGEQMVKVEDKLVNEKPLIIVAPDPGDGGPPLPEDFLTPATLADAQSAHDNAPEAKPFVKIDSERKAFFRDFNELMKQAGVPASDWEGFRHNALDGSLETYTKTRQTAILEIKSFLLDTGHRLNRNQTDETTIGETIKEKESKELDDKQRRARAMSLICPSGNGSIVYKNVKYMRQATAIEDPEDLTLGLQAWAAWWESVKALGIAPHDSCVVRDITPAAQRPTAPVTAPATATPPAPAQQTPAATPANGDEVKRDKATWLIKEVKVTGDGQKVTYELRPTINGRMGDFQIVTVRNDRDKKALADALAQNEIDLDTLAPGTHRCNLAVAWKHGKETAPNSGKFYRDIIGITSVDNPL